MSYRRDPTIPPGSRDPGIGNPPIPNRGIEKTGPGLESLHTATGNTDHYARTVNNACNMVNRVNPVLLWPTF